MVSWRHLLVVLGLVAATLPASAQETSTSAPPAHSITVLGEASYNVPPEILRLAGHVETRGDTIEAARDAHPALAAKVRRALDELAAKSLKIERSTYRINEDRPYQYSQLEGISDEMRAKVEYTATTSFVLTTTNLTDAAAIITQIVQAGMVLDTTTFEVANDRVPLLEARRRAAADALEQAQAYADALHLRLVGVHSLVDGRARPIDGYADLGVVVNADGTVPLSIVIPETIGFYGSVDVVWEVEPAS